ncbi:hypothetical protein GCK72_008390 [Caenorhabditis remanei]|uniref:Exonuclease 1 n=1 Tax=Caenorhabditis remanei TaxID=31234 RepID=A0A6A5H042_CAERE|nr:hypothetical protein GCK72_008390 [Caenorhabditis remanei]KAF1760144.1 hypothetical protein GCK72_008390 [Caenorhabditis remanei]
MGITGLLPFVKNACRKGNILELRGKSVAIDVSCLLHRGLTGCMDKIHMGEETKSYINYVDKYVKELLAMGCHVVMVFDGRPLPAKKGTNDDRREQREKRKEQAEMLLAKGKEREARDTYRLATSISTEIVQKTIEFFRKLPNVDIVVAPYEADAQLAYLMESKLVDAVITEDSDLIVFGCEMIYFKWQSATGECSVYQKCNLKKCFTGELGGDKFDFSKFRRICILSGCDYLQSGLPGVGLSTAAKFFSLTSIKDLRTVLRKVPSYLKNPKLKEHVTEEFIRSFARAENTFKHQIVFDPRERCHKPLTPYPTSGGDGGLDCDDLDVIDLESPTPSPAEISTKFVYAGTPSTQRIAIRLALGNPSDGNSIDDRFLLTQPIPDWSVWAMKYESKGTSIEKIRKKKDEEATQCGGAFKLDSPSVVRRVKVPKKAEIEEEDDIVKQFMADIEKEKQALLKKRKNAPQTDYNAENVLKKYTEEPPVKKTRVEESLISPLLSHQNSAPENSKYFAKKTEILENDPPKRKNPFRCPAFVKPTPKIEEIAEIPKKTTILAALEDNVVETTTSYRFVGFKSAGLRRKSKN